jgi:hypothetical protein
MPSEEAVERSTAVRQSGMPKSLVAIGLVVLAAWTLAALHPMWDQAWKLDCFHWTCALCAAAWVAWRSTRAADDSTRRVRRRFALGLALLAAGQFAWDALSFIGWNPFPGIPNLLSLMLGPCFVLGFAAMVDDQVPRATWTSALLDVAGFGLAVLAFTLALYLPHGANRGVLEFAVLTAYPVLLFAAAAANSSTG